MTVPSEITYTTDDPAALYVEAIDSCVTLDDLKQTLSEWETLAPDAAKAVASMTETEFPAFVAGLKKERRGEFSGEEWISKWGMILMPEKMFKATMTSMRYGAPWGLAWIRLENARREA